MIDMSALLIRARAPMELLSRQSYGGKTDYAETNGFAAVFRKLSGEDTSRGTPDAGNAQSMGDGEDMSPELKPEDNKLPDELAALAGAAIIQDKQIVIQPEQEGKPQVVSILEGSMDIEAQPPVPADAPAETAGMGQDGEISEEFMARMPKEQGQANRIQEKPVNAKGENVNSAEDGGPCPLENKNDSAKEAPLGQDKGRGHDEAPGKDGRVFGTDQQINIAPERLAGAERLSAGVNSTPVPAPATTETLLSTMVQSIETSAAEGSKYMEIQLKPDFLGKVAIQLALTDGGLEIRIKSEDMGVRNLIAGQITQLSETLSEKGVKVTAIDVVYADMSEHAFGQSGSKNRQQGNPAYDGYNDASSFSFGLGFTEDEAVSMVDAGISSVEYRA